MLALKQSATALSWDFDPLEALRRWPVAAAHPPLLLHSGRLHPRWATYSILTTPAGWFRFVEGTSPASGPVPPADATRGEARAGFSQFVAVGDGPALVPPQRLVHRPFRDLRTVLSAAASDAIWVGYLSYDLGRWIEPRVTVPDGARCDRDWPLIELAYCPGYLLYDLAEQRWFACGAWRDGGFPSGVCPPHRAAGRQGLTPSLGAEAGAPGVTDGNTDTDRGSVPRAARLAFRGGTDPAGGGTDPIATPQSLFTRAGYESAVRRVLDYIAAGDIFQANLAQRFTSELRRADPPALRALFQCLATVSPAWYGAYLELPVLPSPVTNHQPPPTSLRAVASTSPELFLEVSPPGNVVTRPIKGTLPARADAALLRASAKDAAELNMIVDLMRNDLGRVCDYGSVRVASPRDIETHPTVHHGVATITGRLHPRKDLVDLLRATLPGGSVTGAPKIRAMQIIDELEPVRRGPYCGCIGWLQRDAACLNIAIRTILVEAGAGTSVPMSETPRVRDLGAALRGRLDFSVGGGIVADSDPAREYQETLDKAAAILAALGATAP